MLRHFKITVYLQQSAFFSFFLQIYCSFWSLGFVGLGAPGSSG